MLKLDVLPPVLEVAFMLVKAVVSLLWVTRLKLLSNIVAFVVLKAPPPVTVRVVVPFAHPHPPEVLVFVLPPTVTATPVVAGPVVIELEPPVLKLFLFPPVFEVALILVPAKVELLWETILVFRVVTFALV